MSGASGAVGMNVIVVPAPAGAVVSNVPSTAGSIWNDACTACASTGPSNVSAKVVPVGTRPLTTASDALIRPPVGSRVVKIARAGAASLEPLRSSAAVPIVTV